MKIKFAKNFSFATRVVMACATLIMITPTQSIAQCDASFGDTGYVGGSFFDQGVEMADGGFGGGLSGADCGPNGPCAANCGGPYISIIGGYVGMQDQSVGGRELEYDDGFAVGGAIGRRLTMNFRVEAEYIYRENDFAGETGILPAVPVQPFGELLSHTGMINGYFDIPIGVGTIVPYLGAGVGVTGIDSELGQASVFGDDFSVFDFDSSFAFQWMAGVTVRTLPNAELFVEYRFFEANDPQFELASATTAIVDSEYVNDNVFFGVRMNF